MLRVPEPARDICNTVLQPLNIFHRFLGYFSCWDVCIWSTLDNFPSRSVCVTNSVL